MEEPCRCQCGKWFELEDGKPKKDSNEIICIDCWEEEKEDED